MGKKNDVQRLPAEALFQKEIDALIQGNRIRCQPGGICRPDRC